MKRTLSISVLKGALRLSCCVLALALAATFSFAQENTGSLRGAVKDQAGAAIPGARVVASSSALVLDRASRARPISRVPEISALAGSIEISATFAIDVTARGPGGVFTSGTIFVPGFSGAKLFLLHTGICRSTRGANVRGCSTFAPL